MTERIAIIPARGGSKRIPRKNLREFCGRPVLFHAVETARESGCFDEVMVSTDCFEIAAAAEKAGAKVPFLRCAESSGDHATTMDVIREVLGCYGREGRQFDMGCCIYPVTPFLRADRIREAMALLHEKDPPETVFAALRYPHPIQRAMKIEGGRVRLFFPEYAQTRTQDLVPSWHDAGQFYAFRTGPLLERGCLLGPESSALALSFDEAHDIDTPEDWAEAEWKYRYLQGKAVHE